MFILKACIRNMVVDIFSYHTSNLNSKLVMWWYFKIETKEKFGNKFTYKRKVQLSNKGLHDWCLCTIIYNSDISFFVYSFLFLPGVGMFRAWNVILHSVCVFFLWHQLRALNIWKLEKCHLYLDHLREIKYLSIVWKMYIWGTHPGLQHNRVGNYEITSLTQYPHYM